jgi:glycosyltransferase involved in cell wall biosynthesis
MASGRAVVAAIDPGTEVVRLIEGAQCGVAVAPDDPTALIEALRTMLDDPSQIRQMGERAREFVEHVASPAAVAQRYVEVLHHLRDGRRDER